MRGGVEDERAPVPVDTVPDVVLVHRAQDHDSAGFDRVHEGGGPLPRRLDGDSVASGSDRDAAAEVVDDARVVVRGWLEGEALGGDARDGEGAERAQRDASRGDAVVHEIAREISGGDEEDVGAQRPAFGDAIPGSLRPDGEDLPQDAAVGLDGALGDALLVLVLLHATYHVLIERTAEEHGGRDPTRDLLKPCPPR